MLMTVIMTIIVAGITATIMLRFRNEEKTSMAKVVLGSMAVGLCVSVLNNYLVPDHSGLAWLFMLICFAFIGALVYQWRKQGSDLVEFLCFSALTLIVGGIACAAAANYKAVFPMLLSVWIPILAIGYYGVAAMRFHAARNTLSDEERTGLLKQKKEETVAEMDKKAVKFGRYAITVGIITLLVLSGTTGLVLGISSSGLPGKEQVVTADAADADIGADSRFVQNWAKNENNRIDSEFLPKLLKKANGDKITEDDFEEVLLDDCAHDARILAIVANNLKLKKDVSYDDLLTSDKKYLSEEGEKLYYKVEGALETANLLRTEVDSSGTNTGMNNDTYVVSSEAGVSGDLEGTKIVTSDGKTTFYILDRCANVVYPGGVNPPKKVPNGDTDNPTPMPTPTPTPTPTPSYSKNPSEDPVNKGNAQKGGGQNKPSDGAGEVQPVDPRTEHPTGSGNDNNHGYSDPKTVTPSNPPVVEEHKSEPVVTDSNPMNYQPDPVTNRGPVDTSVQPTSPEGDGEFTPAD